MMKTKSFRPFLYGLAALGVFAGFIPAADAGLTGTCGVLFATPHLFLNAYGSMTGSVTSTGAMTGNYISNAVGPNQGPYGVDVLAEINFSNSTVSYNVMQVSFNASANESYSASSGSVPFTTTAGPAGLPGSSTITFTPTGSPPMSLIILPVNSGNTILVQGTTDSTRGVCQMM